MAYSLDQLRKLRNKAEINLVNWNIGFTHVYEAGCHLAKILNFKEKDGSIFYAHHITDKQISLLEKLNSPHGYVIYKAILQQKEKA